MCFPLPLCLFFYICTCFVFWIVISLVFREKWFVKTWKQVAKHKSRIAIWNPAVVSDRIARAFDRTGATQAAALDISKVFDSVWHAGLLHKVKSYEISVRYVALFLLFSVIGSFRWFWMGNLHRNIQLMLEFVNGPSLSYMLSVILLSMLMILLSILSVIRHLISGNNLNGLLNLNLTYQTLWTVAGSGLLISMLEKLN